jgi:D-alanyl-lipoteichoic acid acyltransferase DltB (MBOAT superfamily)
MLFNSLEYALFLVGVLAIYWTLPHRAQNRFLLAASYVFYGAWDWRFLGLIALSTLLDWGVGLGLGAVRDPRRRRALLVASVVANLGILATFKYAGFFAASLAEVAAWLGFELTPFTLEVVLPVGVSFYTFQSLSYTIDVYRGRLAPTRSLADFALYVAFFPQLVAGPIERATHLLPEIQSPRRFDWDRFGAGSWLILWGTFKKTVVADNLAFLVDMVYAPASPATGGEVLVATFAFAIQIYCDFSGYTDVARGSAKLLGFELMHNFARPYFAASPAEFWQRWHISLSTWLRDYLYIPLGGNRHGTLRTYRNLILTMLLGGLWHGAAWTFVLWGAFHGVWLTLHRALEPALARRAPRAGAGAWLWQALCIAVTFFGVCFGWLLFRASSLADAVRLLQLMISNPRLGRVDEWLLPLGVLVLPLLAMECLAARAGRDEPVLRWPFPLRVATYTLIFYAIVFLGEDFGAPFIYFQF